MNSRVAFCLVFVQPIENEKKVGPQALEIGLFTVELDQRYQQFVVLQKREREFGSDTELFRKRERGRGCRTPPHGTLTKA